MSASVSHSPMNQRAANYAGVFTPQMIRELRDSQVLIYPAWQRMALSVIAGGIAGGFVTFGIFAAAIVIPVGALILYFLVIPQLKEFAKENPTYLDPAKTQEERFRTAMAQGHRLGLTLLNLMTVVGGGVLGNALGTVLLCIPSAAPFAIVGSMVAGVLGAWDFNGNLSGDLPSLQLYYAKLYDSLMLLPLEPSLGQAAFQRLIQEESESYKITLPALQYLVPIYTLAVYGEGIHAKSLIPEDRNYEAADLDDVFTPFDWAIYGLIDNFYAQHPSLFQNFFKHLLPLMKPNTIGRLILKYPRLQDWAFLRECFAFHPIRLNPKFTRLVAILAASQAEGRIFQEHEVGVNTLHACLCVIALLLAGGKTVRDREIALIIKKAKEKYPGSAALFQELVQKLSEDDDPQDSLHQPLARLALEDLDQAITHYLNESRALPAAI